ncbi:pectate lyase [Stieleria marina]|uniref:Pectic acid lyase n=1 Tax=Stieleria marina TaxID=1930275 RepID=A0A517NM74_9BACT|nr:Pectic acid lyase [Planctomycetes bacterium K23_9]
MNRRATSWLTHLIVSVMVLSTLDAAAAPVRFSKNLLKNDEAWFRSDEARCVADIVIQYQSPQGGWPKSTDLGKRPESPADIPQPGGGRANSMDNDATTVPMKFMARMAHATGDDEYRQSFLRGVDYLLAAQYPNGGWPQFWPLRKGYYSHITYNDGAMIQVIDVIRDVANGKAPYDFVDSQRRKKAAESLARGINCIVKTQVKRSGKLTVWCAQHDAESLAPAKARSYEHPSLSGSESAGVLMFLMSLPDPSPEVVRAVEAGAAWFASTGIQGYRYERSKSNPALSKDSNARTLWARFYEIETDRPIFSDRDGIIKYDIEQIGSERRSGYTWYGNWGDKVANQFAKWPHREDR